MQRVCVQISNMHVRSYRVRYAGTGATHREENKLIHGFGKET
jgi:hypothetical protein